MDISEEYDKYAMEQEIKHTGRVYVDRPRDREREFQDQVYQQSYRPTNFDQFQQNFYLQPLGFTTNRSNAASTMRSQRSNFDPQFITKNPHMTSSRQKMLMPAEQQSSR